MAMVTKLIPNYAFYVMHGNGLKLKPINQNYRTNKLMVYDFKKVVVILSYSKNISILLPRTL